MLGDSWVGTEGPKCGAVLQGTAVGDPGVMEGIQEVRRRIQGDPPRIQESAEGCQRKLGEGIHHQVMAFLLL